VDWAALRLVESGELSRNKPQRYSASPIYRPFLASCSVSSESMVRRVLACYVGVAGKNSAP
jgi:hypothetical protein